MKSFKIIFIFSLIALTVFSCKKEEEEIIVTPTENSAPTIEIVTPENHQNYSIGDTIHIMAHFEDDKALASYHVYIATEDGVEVSGFLFDESDNTLDEDHHHYMKNIVIPDTAPMMFWIHFDVTDSDGVDAEHVKLMQHAM